MNTKAKEFITAVMKDEALKAKVDSFPTPKDEAERQAITEEKIIPFAKTLGYDLTLEDFTGSANGELDDNELDAVAGAGACACVFGGGGGGTDSRDGHTYGCACVLYGQGGDGTFEDANCWCPMSGAGADGTQYNVWSN